ncbi:hypothetical protein CSHISOI_10943 [Colletotrichum shisoi]|uniref:Nudix hydrolase domain-containing protein n=1 Tax=Colletotrichum shisoi TaxID=2078593 RepID=A0A5Q4BCN3_9PEZI|nr:hypothetical protein CSHISOI_10943 [Colletotrichum shisoi]
MPPALPSRPLSYTTAPSVLPYALRFHPYAPSATSQVHHTHRLCVGAAVISTPSSPDRSAREKALPHRWELPGGGAESRDGDALAAAARELWEETGLRAARFAALVGAAATAVPGDQAWGLSGGGVGVGVGVAESVDVVVDVVAGGRRDAWRKYTYLVEIETEAETEAGGRADVVADVVVDPEEHEAFVWATEDEARAGRCGDVVLDWTSENQRLEVLRAFEIAKKGRRWSDQRGSAR